MTRRYHARAGATAAMGGLLLLLGLWCPGVLAEPAPSSLFPTPEALAPNVAFWKRVFAVLDNTGGALHDMTDVSIVYHIWYNDLPGDSAIRQMAIDEVRNRYRTILNTLADGKRFDLSSDEQRVWEMFQGKQYPDAFRAAGNNMRFQGGMRTRFAEGVARSLAYLPEMEQIFAEAGLPLELTRLPHVESSFENRALSKVGAAGVWQIMPSTGRRFLRVDGEVDERLNIRAATTAAARLLRENYEKLGTWPLAITAYNHGANGMKQAVATVGTTDFGVIVQRYRGPLFGFASQNFYAEFLAALDISNNYKHYFGDVVFTEPSRPVMIEARSLNESDRFIPVTELLQPVTVDVRTASAPLPVVATLAHVSLPRGGAEPHRASETFPAVASLVHVESPPPSQAVEEAPAESDPIVSTPLPVPEPPSPVISPPPERPREVVHTPRPTRTEPLSNTVTTPFQVAAPTPAPMVPRPTPVAPRAVAYALPPVSPPPAWVAPRQPATEARLSTPAPMPPPAWEVREAREAREAREKDYRVRPGDTLFSVAQRHGTTVAALAALNGLNPRSGVRSGQTLQVPSTTQPAPQSAPTPAPPFTPPAMASAEKTPPKGVIVPVMSPFKTTPVLPVPRPTVADTPPPAATTTTPAEERFQVKGDTIRIAAQEQLSQYAEWLDVPVQRLLTLNRLTARQTPPLGTALRLDFAKVATGQFTQKRLQYHRGLEEEFLRRNRIGEVVTRTLKPGETLLSVSREMPSVPLWLLQRYNAHLDLHAPRPGSELRIPKVVAKVS